MTDVVFIPIGGLDVLSNVAEGRSPWHGWENVPAHSFGDGREAHANRRQAILDCRTQGLLTDENQLTARARDYLKRLGGKRG